MALFAFLSVVVVASLVVQLQIPNSGQVNAVGLAAYVDSACTKQLTFMVWRIDPGSSASQIIYLKNTNNSDITLTMNTVNWVGTPANSTTTLTLSWNAPSTLAAGQVAPITFTLTSTEDTGSLNTFAFNVNIIGTKT